MTTIITSAELVSKFKTKEHFIDAFETNGKVIPTEISFGWNFIRQVMIGEKRLLDQRLLEGFNIPPR